MVGDGIGLTHLVSSIISLISGTVVLIVNKGTLRHRTYGYVYCVSMVVTLITSFFIYRLYNKFGLFHFFSLLSSFTLIRGMLPLYFKRTENSLQQHFRAMFWSVIGLYAAFVSELLVRIPQAYQLSPAGLSEDTFRSLVLIATLMVVTVFAVVFRVRRSKWIDLTNHIWRNRKTFSS